MKLLRLAALVALLIGMGAIGYVYFYLQPRLEQAERDLRLNIATIDEVTDLLQKNYAIFVTAVTTAASTADFASSLPRVLPQLQKTLDRTSKVLSTTSDTANKTKKGLVGLVLPTKEVGESEKSLDKTSGQVHNLSQSLKDYNGTSKQLAEDATKLSDELNSLKPQFESTQKLLTETKTRLNTLSNSIGEAHLPFQISLLISLIASLHLVAALILYALSNLMPVKPAKV